MSNLAANYGDIIDRITKKKKVLLVLGDGHVYNAVYKWKNDPEDGDVIGFFSKKEFRVGYIASSDWDETFADWFFTTINLLPFAARQQNKQVASRQPSMVPLESVECIFRKVRKAKAKGA